MAIPLNDSRARVRWPKRERFDIIYCECWGDIAGAFEFWRNHSDDSNSPVVPYASQFFEFAKQAGARTYALSGCQRPALAHEDGITVAHHPRRVSRLPLVGYHLEQFRYALLLFVLALRYRPRTMIVDSGVTDWIFLAPLRLLGIRIVSNLHNSIWPNGFPPETMLRRLLIACDRMYFRYVADAVFCVSPIVRRQVEQLAENRPLPIVEFSSRFEDAYFVSNPDAPRHADRPFQVLFAGRVERKKGVFDLLEAARLLDSAVPGGFAYDICGDGRAYDELAQCVAKLGMSGFFRLHGRLGREQLLARYRAAHVVVVPTRSDFCEGYAQVVAEAVLLGRPVVTNLVVPALETLNEAIVESRPDDAPSLAACIRILADDPDLFAVKRSACVRLRADLFDHRRSFLAKLIEHRKLFDLSAPV